MGNDINLSKKNEFTFETEEETIKRLNQKDGSDRIILSQYFSQNSKNTSDTNILKEFKSRKRKNVTERSNNYSKCEDENFDSDFRYTENIKEKTSIDKIMIVPAYFLPKDNIKIVDSLRMSEYCSYLLKPPKEAKTYELEYDNTINSYENDSIISYTQNSNEASKCFRVQQKACINNEFTVNNKLFENISDNINENDDILRRLDNEDSPFQVFINESSKDNISSSQYHCNSIIDNSHEGNDFVINVNNIQGNIISNGRASNNLNSSINCEQDVSQLLNSVTCKINSIENSITSSFEISTQNDSDKNDIITRLENECLSFKIVTNESNKDECIICSEHFGGTNIENNLNEKNQDNVSQEYNGSEIKTYLTSNTNSNLLKNNQHDAWQTLNPDCETNDFDIRMISSDQHESAANINGIVFQNTKAKDIISALDSQPIITTSQYFSSSNIDNDSIKSKASQIERNTFAVVDSAYYSQASTSSQNEKIICSQYFSSDVESQLPSSQSKSLKPSLNLSKLKTNLAKCGIQIKDNKVSSTIASSFNKETLNEDEENSTQTSLLVNMSSIQTKNINITENLRQSSKLRSKLNKNLNIIPKYPNNDYEQQGEENITCSQYFSTSKCTENVINSEQGDTTSEKLRDDKCYTMPNETNIQMNIIEKTRDIALQNKGSKRKKSDTQTIKIINCTRKRRSEKSTPEDESEESIVFTKDFLPNKLHKFKNEPNKRRLKIPLPKSGSPRIPLGKLKPLWTPPKSPHGLIEEDYTSNPWGLLVATIFLNKTSGKQAKPYIDAFLQKYPNPESVISKKPEDLELYFVELGLIKTRANQIWRMSKDFLEKKWKNARELYGIGKYGDDAFRLFCIGDLSVEPSDRYLKIYHSWVKNRHVTNHK